MLLLTNICMSGIFCLTLWVRYFSSDYSDLLGLNSLLACQAILWYGSWILKHTYVNRNQFTLYVQCCLVYPVYVIPTPPWVCNCTTIFHIVFVIICIYISLGPVGWYIYICGLSIYILYRRTYTLCTCIGASSYVSIHILTIYLYYYYFYVACCIVRCCEHLSAFSLHTGRYSWCHFTLRYHAYCIACIMCWASGPCYFDSIECNYFSSARYFWQCVDFSL